MSKARAITVAAGGISALVLAAVPIVQQYEGRRNDPYFDIAGILTVCDGETANVQRRRYSDAECDAMAIRSLTKHANAIQACYRPASTPMPTQVAYLSLAYNIGPTAFCASTTSRRALAGDLSGSCEAMLRWNKIRKPVTRELVFSKGLDNRRRDERRLCLEGLG